MDDDFFKPPDELKAAWNRHPAIVKLGDPVLRQVAKPVTHAGAELHKLIERMIGVMQEAYGLGLAAPQVGVSERIIVYKLPEDKAAVHVLINPKIVSARGEQVEPLEGCLSIPGLQGKVKRAQEIRVKGFDKRMKPVMLRACDLEARVIQHEIDHLDGVLFIDRVAEEDVETLEWAIALEEDEEEDEPPALRE